jgi:hypothetical protein
VLSISDIACLQVAPQVENDANTVQLRRKYYVARIGIGRYGIVVHFENAAVNPRWASTVAS